MAEPSSPGLLNDYTQRLIRVKAQQLTRRRGFTPSDREDMEQELAKYLLERADRFDPRRATFNTFAARVLDSAVAMILRDRQRLKRAGAFTAMSLEKTVHEQDAEATSGRDALSEADMKRRTGAAPEDATADFDQAEALSHAMHSMPLDLREMCRRLMHGNVASVARDMGISRRHTGPSRRSGSTSRKPVWRIPEDRGHRAPRRHT
jgi:RNA polymerase sigma-70 factor (ECF subfamily)